MIDECLFIIDTYILNNYELIITYVQEDEELKYDCRGPGGRPSPRCYDSLANPARKIAGNVKSALANPYTELGRRRILSDYSDLVGYRFGAARGKNNINRLIKYLNTL